MFTLEKVKFLFDSASLLFHPAGIEKQSKIAALRKEAFEVGEALTQHSLEKDIFEGVIRIQGIREEIKTLNKSLKHERKQKDYESYYANFKPVFDKIRRVDELYFQKLLNDITQNWLKSLLLRKGKKAKITFNNKNYWVCDYLKGMQEADQAQSPTRLKGSSKSWWQEFATLGERVSRLPDHNEPILCAVEQYTVAKQLLPPSYEEATRGRCKQKEHSQAKSFTYSSKFPSMR